MRKEYMENMKFAGHTEDQKKRKEKVIKFEWRKEWATFIRPTKDSLLWKAITIHGLKRNGK